MAGKSNFIPSVDGDFDQFFKNITQYVAAKCGGTTAVWTHISKDARDDLNAQYAAWYSAWGLTLKPHTPVETKEKNRVRKIAEKALRNFINAYLRYHPDVTDEDRDAMGIPNADKVRTHHDVVTEDVEFYLEAAGNGRVRVHFKVKGVESKAKPDGYDGAVIVWDILTEPPKNQEALREHDLASRTPYLMKFPEEARGGRVYAAMCWQNGKAVKGAWSEIQWTIVP